MNRPQADAAVADDDVSRTEAGRGREKIVGERGREKIVEEREGLQGLLLVVLVEEKEEQEEKVVEKEQQEGGEGEEEDKNTALTQGRTSCG